MAETLLNESGQLAVATGVLYTVPASTQAIISGISLVNTGAVTRVVNVFYRPSGGSLARIAPKDLSMVARDEFLVKGQPTLSAGDTIEGDAAAANEVDYTIFGVEIT